MALRQRQWVIYTRPYGDNRGQKVFYTKTPKAATADILGQGTGVVDVKPITVLGGVNNISDSGGWVVSFRSYSISEVKRAYKELLKEIPSDYIRITEEIPFDTMIIPIS